MPLVNIFSSVEPLAPPRAQELLLRCSRIAADLLGKPEKYVMTCLMPQTAMTFGGSAAPSCYLEVKSVGRMPPETTLALSAALSAAVEEHLGVAPGRTYVEFSDAQGHLWGFNGGTFG